jgi:sialic acid synthase SpsE
MIDVAAESGANAVKFQTAIPEEVVSLHAPKARYQKERTTDDNSQLEMLRNLHFAGSRDDAYLQLAERAFKRGIELLSTPFDLESLGFLVQDVGLKKIKLASGDLTCAPLLLAASQSECDIILSTGMASIEEIEAALGVVAFGALQYRDKPGIEAFRAAYSDQRSRTVLRQRVTLLHCVTAYPTPPEQSNLKAMATLHEHFGVKVGFSDHSLGTAMAIAAVALGATVVEKHFTLDRSLPGPDQSASLEPQELASLIQDIRLVEQGLGTGIKEPQACERENIPVARRSLVARVAIQRGELLTEHNLAVKRPAGGLSPFLYWRLLGTVAENNFAADEAITCENLR